MRIYNTYLILRKGLKPKYNFLCIPVLVFLLWSPQTLLADIDTLERVAKAEREVNYVGVRLKTFISSKGTRTFEELVIHKSPDIFYGKELCVIGEPQGENRRDNRRKDRNENRSRDRDYEQHKWHQVKSLFSEKKVKLIAQNYNLEKSASTEEIASYETELLTITPKFTGRPTQRIFFARENGAILRVEAFDPEGVLRAMTVYTRISFDPEIVEHKWEVFQKEIELEPRLIDPISLATAEELLKTKPIQPEYLPPGFQLQDIREIKGRKNTIHLIYTDGLLRFSIFETTDKRARRGSEKRRGSDVIELDGTRVHKHQRGPTHAFSWSSADVHFFLFGAMPASEMQKVVKSIIHKTKEK